jgi:Tol biopolymer transport system component
MNSRWVVLCLLAQMMISQIAVAQTNDSSGKIAFVSSRDGSSEVYLITTDGSNVERLTYNDLEELYLAWSPDGSQLAFTAQSEDGSYQIFVMNVDGSNLRQLTDTQGYNLRPTWSPDGTQIAFEAQRNTQHDIFVIDVDGTNETNITDSLDASEHCPEWSPDGSRFIYGSDRGFESTRGVPDFIIFYTMLSNGSDVVALPNGGDIVSCFAWSPDGTTIAYSASSGIDRELYLMSADGTDVTTITASIDTLSDVGTPDWSPDGSQIVFTANHNSTTDIYIINVDGSQLVNLTQDATRDSNPVWQPNTDLASHTEASGH